ncbi:uncharacterized protein swt1 isoform X2 [Pristis pectinata]|uniref:uncharacterized protein swt1 isoform X2 n=1 Tax=Pristis pectinata TaxID=685728 RepID=UPI00223E8C88|nr:uncharacterized protein swt1 isoform X2 [Pristis pectinata]
MSRKHSKHKREKDKSRPKKSKSQRHSPNHAGEKGKTEQKPQYSGGSSLPRRSSLSPCTGKRRKLSHLEVEIPTTLKQSMEEQAKSSQPRSPDFKEKHKFKLQKRKYHAASLGTTSSSDYENTGSKSKQKKKHKKHSREENRKEKHHSSSTKHTADTHVSGEQPNELQWCKKCQSSKFCKHLQNKCKAKPSITEVDLEVLKTKISGPTYESLQTDFQDFVSKTYIFEKAEEACENDASKHSTVEPTWTTSKLTSSYDEPRPLSEAFESKGQTKKSSELQGESNYSGAMQNSEDSRKVPIKIEELNGSKNKSLRMNLHEKPKISKKEFDVWKVTKAPLKAVKNTASFNDGSKFLESGFWEKCNKISNCLRGLRKKSKSLEPVRDETGIERASSYLTKFSEKPGDDSKPLEVEKPSISFEEPTTSGTVDREFKLSTRPGIDSRSTKLINEGRAVLGYSQKHQASNSTQQSRIFQRTDGPTFSSRNSENAEKLEVAKQTKKFHSFKILKKVYATDALSQAVSKKLLTSSGTRSVGKSSDSATKPTSLPQDLALAAQQPGSPITCGITTSPDDANMDTDQKMEIAEELQTARYEKVLEVELGQSYGELTSMEIDPPEEVKTLSFSEATSQPDILLVLDTNIFISHLNFIVNLKDHGVSVIPWVVLQELDSLKSGKLSGGVNRKAVPAVHFVYSCFKSRHPHVWGQSMQQAAQKFCGLREENNDDRVLQCCMQYQQLYPCAHVLLCSDDKNLCSKALVSSVKAVRKVDLLTELRSLKSIPDVTNTQDLSIFNQPQSAINVKDQNGTGNQHLSVEESALDVTSIISQLEKCLGCALSVILETEMKKVYDDLWMEILFVKPPWSLEDILLCMKKHWIAVFGLLVKRNLQSSVESLSDYLQADKWPKYNRFVVTWMLTESQKLLQAFSSISDYGGVLPNTLAVLDELLSKISEGVMKIEPNSKSLERSKNSSEKVEISAESALQPNLGRNITLPPFNCNTGDPMSEMENSQVVNKSQQIWATFENVWNIINKYSSLIFATFNLPHNSFAVVMDSKLPLPEEAFQSLQKLVPAVKELLAGIQRILSSDSNVQDFEKLMEILHIFLTNEETNNSATGISAQDLHECFTHEEYRKKLTVGYSQLAELTYNLEQCNAAVCLEARNRGLV